MVNSNRKKYAVFVKFACKPDACLTSVRTKISCVPFHSEMVLDINVLVKRVNISPMYEGKDEQNLFKHLQTIM